MSFNKVNKEKKETSKKLRAKIRATMIRRDTRDTVEIKKHLFYDYGIEVSARTIRTHRKDLELEAFSEKYKKEIEEKKEVKEIKIAVKHESKREFPYYIITPCIHKARIKITNNPNQSGACANCGCSWDRKNGKWIDRFNDCDWGKSPKTVTGHVSQLMFDY